MPKQTVYTNYTVAELLALDDTTFINVMRRTVWGWVMRWTRGQDAELGEELWTVAMTAVCAARSRYCPKKNKAFIPWARIYAEYAIRNLVRFRRDVVRLPPTQERRLRVAGKPRPNVAVCLEEVVDVPCQTSPSPVEQIEPSEEVVAAGKMLDLLSKKVSVRKLGFTADEAEEIVTCVKRGERLRFSLLSRLRRQLNFNPPRYRRSR